MNFFYKNIKLSQVHTNWDYYTFLTSYVFMLAVTEKLVTKQLNIAKNHLETMDL